MEAVKGYMLNTFKWEPNDIWPWYTVLLEM
jgi:hypothetical protein